MKIRLKGLKWGYDGSEIEFLIENGIVIERGVGLSGEHEIDFGGQWILPGFVDCHCHILPTGLDLQKLELRGVKSRQEMEILVREKARTLPENEWLLAVHYDANLFDDGVNVSADELESWSFGRPAILRHTSGHSCITNRTGLRFASVHDFTEDPQGGRIVRDEKGVATGLLEEGAMGFVYRVTPKPTVEQMADAILAAAESMSGYGITCASDMMTGQFGLEKEINAYQLAMEMGAKIRFRLYVQWHKYFREPEILDFNQSEKLKVSGLKLFCDGAIGSGTAGVYEEFTTGGVGIMNYEKAELAEMVLKADCAGFQMAIHAIGDRAVDWVLDAYEATGNPSKHRVEHAMILSDEQIKRIQFLNPFVTMQPEFLAEFGIAYRKRLGDERARFLKRVKSLSEAGMRIGLSSDRPIVGGNPWDGIRAAVRRPDGFDASENISISDAIKMYSSGSALMSNDVSFGELRVGQFADFQIYEMDPKEMNETPSAVFLGGIKVF